MNPDGHTATLSDIRRYCRQVDLPVHISDLWSSLDTDGDGRVRMEELCSRRAESLAKFKAWTLRRFGRAVGLWDSQEALRARAAPGAGLLGLGVEDVGHVLRRGPERAGLARCL